MADEPKPPKPPWDVAALQAALTPQPLVTEDGLVDQRAVLKYLAIFRAGTPLVCPLSGHNEWSVVDHLVHTVQRLSQKEIAAQGKQSYPLRGGYSLIQITCNGCGYAFHLDYGLIEERALDGPHGR